MDRKLFQVNTYNFLILRCKAFNDGKKIRRTSIDEVSFDKTIVNILRFTILLSMVSLIKN